MTWLPSCLKPCSTILFLWTLTRVDCGEAESGSRLRVALFSVGGLGWCETAWPPACPLQVTQQGDLLEQPRLGSGITWHTQLVLVDGLVLLKELGVIQGGDQVAKGSPNTRPASETLDLTIIDILRS
jgi:hypothetical protein